MEKQDKVLEINSTADQKKLHVVVRKDDVFFRLFSSGGSGEWGIFPLTEVATLMKAIVEEVTKT